MARNSTRLSVAEVMECTIGGTRRHIVELTIGLAGRGVDVTLFASAVRDPTFRQDLARCGAAGVRVREIPMRREIAPFADVRHAAILVREFARGDFDVVHTHSSKAGALGRFAARVAARSAAIVHTPHTFAFNFAEQFSARTRRIFLAVERALGRVTDRLVHVSRSEREEGIALGIVPPERAIVIENGIDATVYEGRDPKRVRREFGIDDDTPLIGAVGLLNEAKGHAHLIEAVAELRGRGNRVRCLIVGEGALRADLERKIRDFGLDDAVILAGYRRDIPDVLAALDVFAMPSLWEGMPYGVLEAMASSKPVIASDVNGCRDLVSNGETGLLVPPRDPRALASALEQVLSDRDLAARLAIAGRALVRREYSLDAMIDRYVELFQSLAAEKGRGCASST